MDLKNKNMKLVKISPNQGRGTVPIYISSMDILRIDFGSDETNPGCNITLRDGQVLEVFDTAKSIYDQVNG
jgi:hypothetical protein